MLEKEKVGVIYLFSVSKFYTQQIWWKCGIENWKKYLVIRDDNVGVTFANQKLKFDVSKIEKLFYQSVLFFK